MKLEEFVNDSVNGILPSDKDIKKYRSIKQEITEFVQKNQVKTQFTVDQPRGYGSLDKKTMIRGSNDIDLDLVVNLNKINLQQAISQAISLLAQKYPDTQMHYLERDIIRLTANEVQVDLRLLNISGNIGAHYQFEIPNFKFVMLLKWIRNTYYSNPGEIGSFLLERLAKKCHDNLKQKYNRSPTLDELLAQFQESSGSDVKAEFSALVKRLSELGDASGDYPWASLDVSRQQKYKNPESSTPTSRLSLDSPGTRSA